MSGRVKARDTVARETLAASATWRIVGASRRLVRSSMTVLFGTGRFPRGPLSLTRNRLHRIVQLSCRRQSRRRAPQIRVQRLKTSGMESIAASREPVRHSTVERLRVHSFATRRAMGRQAAQDIAVEIRDRLAGAAGVRMIFAAAP